jgi:ribosomal protein S5
VYVATTGTGFAAASEISAVLACAGVDTATSEAGIAQFFSFGHFYGADTLIRGVRAVPPAYARVPLL